MTDRGDKTWHLVVLNWDDGHADLLQELREIAATFAEVDAETNTLYTAKHFTDILGYDGFISVEYANLGGSVAWSNRTYYAVQEDGSRIRIAESFGWGAPQDYSVDLDGTGEKELVSNVTYGGDGHQSVYVYQRRGNEVWLGRLSMEDLPNRDDRGAVSAGAVYDPARNVFQIRYAAKGQAGYALLETTGLERLEFAPYAPKSEEAG